MSGRALAPTLVMAPSWRTVVAVVGLLSLECLALLEERIVQFHEGESTIPITHSNIVYSQDDEVGVHIAAANLANDLELITGSGRETFQWQGPDSPLSDSSSCETAIIVGSLNSSLIRHLAKEVIVDVSELDGKWESFMTTVVDQPLPSVEKALVIAGSDKRGAIFGIYTLSEQAGQSP